MYKNVIKRLIDIVLSFIGILVLWPVMLIIAVVIKIDDPGPVIFKQKRIAKDKNGEKQFFNIMKFRSMKVSAPKDMPTHLFTSSDDFYTKSGRFIRKTSLDELPQIFNIFMGDMSVVGPRPALWNQDDLYEERAKYGANEVTPGLTGWAQINGRDELAIDVKAKFDGEYAKNVSFLFDCKCFFRTFIKVAKSEGILEKPKDSSDINNVEK